MNISAYFEVNRPLRFGNNRSYNAHFMVRLLGNRRFYGNHFVPHWLGGRVILMLTPKYEVDRTTQY